MVGNRGLSSNKTKFPKIFVLFFPTAVTVQLSIQVVDVISVYVGKIWLFLKCNLPVVCHFEAIINSRFIYDTYVKYFLPALD
jgi:hypothetical protein